MSHTNGDIFHALHTSALVQRVSFLLEHSGVPCALRAPALTILTIHLLFPSSLSVGVCLVTLPKRPGRIHNGFGLPPTLPFCLQPSRLPVYSLRILVCHTAQSHFLYPLYAIYTLATLAREALHRSQDAQRKHIGKIWETIQEDDYCSGVCF